MRAVVSVILIVTLLSQQVYGGLAWADEVVQHATEGQDFGTHLLYNGAANLPQVRSDIDPNGDVSDADTLYVGELVPGGVNPDHLQDLKDAYESPDRLRSLGMQERRSLLEDGCPEAHFADVGQRTILTVRAYRVTVDENGQQTRTLTPYTGTISFDVPTIGSDRTWTTVIAPATEQSPGLTLEWRSTPFPLPRGSAFTVNHAATGGHGEVGTITSWGNTGTGFASTGSITLSGSSMFTIQAHAYRVEKTYADPNQTGGVCPPYPPQGCSYEGINLCDPRAAGIRALFDTAGTVSRNAAGAIADAYYLNQEPDLMADPGIASMMSDVKAIMSGTDPITGQLFGGCDVYNSTTETTYTTHSPDYYSCNGVYLSFPPCNSFERDVQFQFIETRTTLTIRQYEYVDNGTRTVQVPVTGSHSVAFPTIGVGSSKRVDIDNGYVIYENTPYPGGSSYFSYNHRITAGSGSITHYGNNNNGWKSSGTVTGDGSLELRVAVDVYLVSKNTVSGCVDFIARARDGWCDFEIQCTDSRTCTTTNGVSYCSDSGPATGIYDLIETFPDIHGNPVIDKTCWAGSAPAMDCNYMIGEGECYTDAQGEVQCVETDGTGLVNHPEIDPTGVDDCEYYGYYNDPDCELVRTECSEDARGSFSGECYAYSVVYDCGEDLEYTVPAGNSYSELCNSPIRCLGTECHNPAGETNGDLAQAAAATEMLQMMSTDMVCAETNSAPTSLTDPCTPVVFNGVARKCKIPIGHSVGLTPDCCREGARAASGVNAIAYLQLTVYGAKLATNPLVAQSIASVTGSSAFTDALLPIANPVESGMRLLNDTLVTPLVNQVKHFGYASADSVGEHAAKEAAKSLSIDGIKQKVMYEFYNFIKDTLGMPELADSIFTVSGGQIALNATLQTILNAISLAFLAYNILKILGHIIFRCSEDELKLGIDRKVGNCTYIGSYCAREVLDVCILKKKSYCCYKTPLARIIMEQARPQLGGFGSKKNPNCRGLTPEQLARVDWSRIDLSEWIARLQQADLVPDSHEEAQARWSMDYPRSMRAYGVEPPGPDGHVPDSELVQLRYNRPRIEDMKTVKQTMEEEPVCYTDPDYMPWYNTSVKPEDVIREVGGTGYVAPCGDGCIDLYLGRVGDNYISDHCTTIHDQYYTFEILRPDLITKAELLSVKWDDRVQILLNNNIVFWEPDHVLPPEVPGTCELSTSWCYGNPGGHCEVTIGTQPIDVTDYFRQEGEVTTNVRVSVGGEGEAYAHVRITYDTLTPDPLNDCFYPTR